MTPAVGDRVVVLVCDDANWRWIPGRVSTLDVPGMPGAVGVKASPAAGLGFPPAPAWDYVVPGGAVDTHLREGEQAPRLRAVS